MNTRKVKNKKAERVLVMRTCAADMSSSRGCDDLTPALLCFIAGAVAFVAVLAVAGILP